MDDWYFEALKMWQQICPPSKENMVFPTHTENGRPMDSTSWVRRIWHPARKAAGVRYLTPKSLRHFSGSYLIDQGENVGYVQDHLGHASSQMTMEVYRHKLRKQNRRAAQKLGSAFNTFFDLNGSKMVAESIKGASHVT